MYHRAYDWIGNTENNHLRGCVLVIMTNYAKFELLHEQFEVKTLGTRISNVQDLAIRFLTGLKST